MKKVYTKPLISVEALTLDQPIAANCNADFDDILSLIDLGYFGENDRGYSCSSNLLPNGGIDLDGDGESDWHDTLCYHSNVQTAFLS